MVHSDKEEDDTRVLLNGGTYTVFIQLIRQKGHIAAAHGQFSVICQIVPTCTHPSAQPKRQLMAVSSGMPGNVLSPKIAPSLGTIWTHI